MWSAHTGFAAPASIAVDPLDGSCWISDRGLRQILHLAVDGEEIWRSSDSWSAESLSVDAGDGSCWVADTGNDMVVHLAWDGTEIWRGAGFSSPTSICANSTDGSCWVADFGNAQVVHLTYDGTEVWRGGNFAEVECVSVNETDGSCWVADRGWHEIVHLAADGREVWRGGGFRGPAAISANAEDGSCWVVDAGNRQVARLLPDGPVFGGFEPPIGRGRARLFRAGRTVPVRFSLTNLRGEPITDALCVLSVYQIPNEPATAVRGGERMSTARPPASGGDGSSLGLCQPVGYDTRHEQYIARLRTRGWSAGTYLLEVTADDWPGFRATTLIHLG
jgi:hypothetical protein